jgi:transposase-like protein
MNPYIPFETALQMFNVCHSYTWYLRYPLSYRNLEEMMLERGLDVDHSTIYRWVL